MLRPKYAVGHEVWIINKDESRDIESKEPFKLIKCIVIGIKVTGEGTPIAPGDKTKIYYKLYDRKENAIIQDTWMGIDYIEDKIYESAEDAVATIISYLDDRIDSIKDLKAKYINMLEEGWMESLDEIDKNIDNLSSQAGNVFK